MTLLIGLDVQVAYGVDFDVPPAKVDKSKSRNKMRLQRLSEKVWRMFVGTLQETHSKKRITDLYPSIHSLDDALDDARRPHPQLTAGSALGLDIYIGDQEIDPAQAIIIPVKTTKATAKATAPKILKVWKPAMDTPKLSNNRLFARIIAKSEEEGSQPPVSIISEWDEESLTIHRVPTWFDSKEPVNPSIHRVNEAIFHASLTAGLDQGPWAHLIPKSSSTLIPQPKRKRRWKT
ncbi:hypothetical protein I350_00033 [Cryptococcus amylolentus CBS 6273]|uniref:Uncharacterized protein n=1 Tax=Cryptococcus amylolentus CBS 6273 TaxID=1296118 RepID=A0A1E3KDT0_9TREE|nr:hypothetical protein I350_00033 [Cryptococcus amylolentus CBS 6273]